MIELNDFIKVYDDVLDNDTCNQLIQFFESNNEKQEHINNNYCPNFIQLNLTENHKQNSDIQTIHNQLIKKTIEYRDKYYEFVDKNVFPETHAFEQFRIKKYLDNAEYRFDTHVDVTDYSSARRYLSFMWYLNDVEVGGHTVFKDFSIVPKTGRLLVFPPLWLFPHYAQPALSGVKYIISTYLHYK
jgi:prolyl 4-hydroxylase